MREENNVLNETHGEIRQSERPICKWANIKIITKRKSVWGGDSTPLAQEPVHLRLLVGNVLSRVWGSVTNNYGFWVGLLDLLSLLLHSFLVTITYNSSQSMTVYGSLHSLRNYECLLFHCDWLGCDLRIGRFFSFRCPLVNTPQLNTQLLNCLLNSLTNEWLMNWILESEWQWEWESELIYNWRFTANQFVLASSPLRLTARIFFLIEHLRS
jgi:hypothetical protein